MLTLGVVVARLSSPVACPAAIVLVNFLELKLADPDDNKVVVVVVAQRLTALVIVFPKSKNMSEPLDE